MPSDRYYVCTACGHYWSFPPDDRRCENCAQRGVTTSVATFVRAQDTSERILGRQA